MSKLITFEAKIWIYQGKGAWYFVNVPEEDSTFIKFDNIFRLRGWGSLPVTVKIGETEWNTSVFPSSKTSCYILPIKAAIRKSEKIKEGDVVKLELKVR